MKNIGFSGSRELSSDEAVIVERVLSGLNGDRVITGACIGVDQFIAEWFVDHRPNMPQTIYVPGDTSRVDLEFVKRMEETPNVNVVRMPGHTSYAQRNMAIVGDCNVLIAFPRYRQSDSRSTRSGTWQTFRKAMLGGKLVGSYVLTELAAG